jgi:hypothetical protein
MRLGATNVGHLGGKSAPLPHPFIVQQVGKWTGCSSLLFHSEQGCWPAYLAVTNQPIRYSQALCASENMGVIFSTCDNARPVTARSAKRACRLRRSLNLNLFVVSSACLPSAASVKHGFLYYSLRLGSRRVCICFRLHCCAPAGCRQNYRQCSTRNQPGWAADARGVTPRCFFNCRRGGYWPTGRRKQSSIPLPAGKRRLRIRLRRYSKMYSFLRSVDSTLHIAL